MAKFEPKHFAKTLDSFAKEVLPPEVYKKWGANGLRKMDQSILEFIDAFRYDTNVPLTINTPWNGQFTQSGMRTADHYGTLHRGLASVNMDKFKLLDEVETYRKMESSLSDHITGRAADVKSSKLTGHELRKEFIANEQEYYEQYGINFIEVGPIKRGSEWVDMSWAHFGKRLDIGQGVEYWSPKHGFVTKEFVLENRL